MITPTIDEPKTAVAASYSRPARRGRLLDPLAVALLAAVISGAAASRPSLWFDEGATISASASRSLPELWRLLGHIDAVHGLYYLLMHGWFAVFPPTEFWSRVPSCLAIGLAAAGVVVFAKQFSSRTIAVCAGVVFAILPRVTWAGVEARSYAFTAVAAIWLTVLLITAIRRNKWWLWLLYAVALMLSILLNIYLVLLVPAYAVVTPVVGRRKSVVVWWAATSAVAVAAMTPFMLFAHGQKFQVGWISRLNWHNVIDVLQHQFFDNSVPFAILAAVILVAALAFRWTGRWEWDRDTRRLLIVCAAWIVVPTAVSLIYSAFEPFYYPRYLFFTTPAMAVVLAVCIVAVAAQTAVDRRCPGIARRSGLPELPSVATTARTPKKAGTTARSPTSSAPMPHPGTACWSTTRWVGYPGRSARSLRPVRRPSGHWSTSAVVRADPSAAPSGTATWRYGWW